MALHWSFGHLQPKLWAKEGPGVKLAVWLPTTKSQESTCFQRVLQECDTALERSRRGLQDWFRRHRDPRLGRGVMALQSPGTPTGTHSGQFRDSISGVPGKCDIRMPLPWSNTKYTIGSKVVAYSRVRAVVSLVSKCPWLVPNTQGCPGTWTNHFVVVLVQIQAWSTSPSS
jgi:hypothetical protein